MNNFQRNKKAIYLAKLTRELGEDTTEFDTQTKYLINHYKQKLRQKEKKHKKDYLKDFNVI